MTLTLTLGLLYSHRTLGNSKLQEELSKPLPTTATNNTSTNLPTATSVPLPPATTPVPAKP
jgi:hypothetical protein